MSRVMPDIKNTRCGKYEVWTISKYKIYLNHNIYTRIYPHIFYCLYTMKYMWIKKSCKILNSFGLDNLNIMILMIFKITESQLLIDSSLPITRVGKSLTLTQQLLL